MANLARHLGVEPETALQETNAKFNSRFQAMEARSREMERDLREMDLAEQDALWEDAKRLEAGESASDPGAEDVK
jgi:uncharacterized protein YabN with tetrapyrrole methylase and pyrophosphatase domain